MKPKDEIYNVHTGQLFVIEQTEYVQAAPNETVEVITLDDGARWSRGLLNKHFTTENPGFLAQFDFNSYVTTKSK